jgi:hypothetical protein
MYSRLPHLGIREGQGVSAWARRENAGTHGLGVLELERAVHFSSSTSLTWPMPSMTR